MPGSGSVDRTLQVFDHDDDPSTARVLAASGDSTKPIYKDATLKYDGAKRAIKAAPKRTDLLKIFEVGKQDYLMVKHDGSKGAHNSDYAVVLLKKDIEKFDQVIAGGQVALVGAQGWRIFDYQMTNGYVSWSAEEYNPMGIRPSADARLAESLRRTTEKYFCASSNCMVDVTSYTLHRVFYLFGLVGIGPLRR